MKTKRTYRELPFKLVRNDRTSLTDQVVSAFRKAIETGYYKPGDLLPPTRKSAEMLGVSLIVTKKALIRLKEEGLVNPRFGMGTEVLPRREQIWKGRVLIVVGGRNTSFFLNAMIGVIRARLTRAGYICQQVLLPRLPHNRYDESLLSTHFSDSILLAINMLDIPAARRCCRKFAVRSLVFDGDGRECDAGVRLCAKKAISEFVRRCVEKGVRSVLQIGFNDRFADASRQLTEEGIGVEWVKVGGDTLNDMAIERIKRDVIRFFNRCLASAKPLPDLVYFTDDYAAEAGLMALALAGVRVPEDVKVVSLANVGNAPVYSKSVSRLEINPVEIGEELSRHALEMLAGGESAPVELNLRYIDGETF